LPSSVDTQGLVGNFEARLFLQDAPTHQWRVIVGGGLPRSCTEREIVRVSIASSMAKKIRAAHEWLKSRFGKVPQGPLGVIAIG
jgi:hypothetical protein